MGRLDQRVAIVTGAGGGIGKGIARRLASEGAAVVVAEYDENTGLATAEGLRSDFGVRAVFQPTDVGDKAQVLAMVDAAMREFGRVDILINNAWARRPGSSGFAPVEAKLDDDMEHAFRIGYMASFWAMQAVFPHMRDQNWGRIVNLASLNGVNAHPYSLDYNAAKEALRTLTRTAAREWARHQICCNVLCPAAATDAYLAFAKANPENAAQMLRQNPMGRMGDAEQDIGSVALFLASEDARYLTGNTLFADGGSHINGVSWQPGTA